MEKNIKILNLFSGKEFILESDEAENIIKIKNNGAGKAFLELRCGAYIDTSAIERITDVPLTAFREGDGVRYSHYLSKDSNGNYFYQLDDGKRKYVELDEVVFVKNPEYEKLINAQNKQLKSENK